MKSECISELAPMESLFANSLLRQLEQKKWTVYRLAKESGVTEGHLRNIISGKRSPTDEVLSKLAPALAVPLDQLKAWARAEGMTEAEERYFWQDAASPLVRMEAAGREIDRLVEEKRALVQGPKTQEAVKRAGEIDALLLALENLLEEEGAKLETEKRMRAGGST